MKPQDRKNKIAMIVYNSVSHDARVLKEADSLARKGYNVRIFGIKDNNNAIPFETLQDNMQIVRVGWRPYLYKRMAVFMLLLTLLVVLSIEAVATWGTTKLNVSVSMGDVFLSLASTFGPFLEYDFWVLLPAALSILIAYYGLRTAIAYFRISSKRHAEESSLIAENKSIRYSRFYILLYLLNPKAIKSGFNQANILFRRIASIWAMKNCVYPELEDYGPDIIHCHDLPTLPLGKKYKNKHKVVLVYDSHEIYEEQGSFGLVQKYIYSMMQKLYSDQIDHFITINDSIARFLTSKYRHLPNPVIVKNATKRLTKRFEYDGRLHKAAGLASGQKILLYQGGYGPKRGLEVLVRSARLLPDGWYLVMMGWGSLEEDLRALARKVDPTGTKLRFVPAVPGAELPYWTAGGSIGVIPYENVNLNHWFCTPNKLWEYPNAGVPLLVSPFPEMRKIVEDNGIGWLLDLELTPENIATAVSNLSDPEIEKAAIACGKFIEQDNWDVYEPRLLALYDQIIKEEGLELKRFGRGAESSG